ncbi:hypothetical protein JX266_010908 [Neoarthrinium moseri]|nr:hypothetical protein JX266_010908 [Neoarthrinium moseri]
MAVFLDLPGELVDNVLLQAILCRGVKRGLRLRLVCKLFSDAVKPALFKSKLLDGFNAPVVNRHWHLKPESYGWRLWHSYLTYRVKNETDPAVGRLAEIHSIAVIVHEECRSGMELDFIIGGLCGLVLEHGRMKTGFHEGWASARPKERQGHGLDLLSAAAYFNMVPLAKRLLAKGIDAAASNELLPSPARLAASAGNEHMLEILQRHAEPVVLSEITYFPDATDWRQCIGEESIQGAAACGDIGMLSLAMRPYHSVSDNPEELVTQCGRIELAIRSARWNAGNPQVFDLLESWLRDSELARHGHSMTRYALARYAEFGRLDMVRHLIDKGVDINGGYNWEGRIMNPLSNACRRCHEDIVDFLVEHGAILDSDTDRDNSLPAAAAAGSLALVQKLIDHGTPVNNTTALQAVCNAVNVENEGIVRLLLQKADFPSDDYWHWIKGPDIDKARKEGLDSMAEILQNWVDKNPPAN